MGDEQLLLAEAARQAAGTRTYWPAQPLAQLGRNRPAAAPLAQPFDSNSMRFRCQPTHTAVLHNWSRAKTWCMRALTWFLLSPEKENTNSPEAFKYMHWPSWLLPWPDDWNGTCTLRMVSRRNSILARFISRGTPRPDRPVSGFCYFFFEKRNFSIISMRGGQLASGDS